MFSIVIPIYNEAQNIDPLICEIYKSLTNYLNFELIIVNDASTDNTLEIINNLKVKFDIILINNPSKKGQSFSIHKGITKSKNKIIVTLDGDGQNNPKDIPLLLDKYLSDDDIFLVGGIRMNRKDSLTKLITSKIANKIRSKILKDDCDDTGCSLKVFDKKIFLKFPFFYGIHRFLPALFTGYGYKTFFTRVDHRPRKRGFSNYGTIDRLYQGIINIMKVKKIINNSKKNI